MHCQVLIPFLWPTGKIRLQLLYVGIGLCLVVNRALNVLVPLQIGLITNILSKPNRKYSYFHGVKVEIPKLLDRNLKYFVLRQ